MRCPSCQHENLPGTDFCEACHQSLTGLPSAAKAKTDLEERIERDPLALLEPAPPITVPPYAPVGDVLKLLAERNIGCVLVVWCDALVGIFSERDALMKIGSRAGELAREPIRHFMTPAPEALSADDSIAFALNRMAVGDFRHVPIETGERPTGVVSVRDMLGYLVGQFPEIGGEYQ